MTRLRVLLWAKALYAEAEQLYRLALSINEKSYGPDHPDVARDLNKHAGESCRRERRAELRGEHER
jgi:hypothetical protein